MDAIKRKIMFCKKKKKKKNDSAENSEKIYENILECGALHEGRDPRSFFLLSMLGGVKK